jgi:hypothetical protein
MRVDERFKKWSKHYNGYGARHLFPEKSQKVPAYKKVERLIHLEIGDLVQHKAYLDPGFIRSGRRPAPRAKGSKEPCVVAGCRLFCHLVGIPILTASSGDTNHLEIFSFDPDTNRRYLDKIVTSIIMKWSKFSIEFDWSFPKFYLDVLFCSLTDIMYQMILHMPWYCIYWTFFLSDFQLSIFVVFCMTCFTLDMYYISYIYIASLVYWNSHILSLRIAWGWHMTSCHYATSRGIWTTSSSDDGV